MGILVDSTRALLSDVIRSFTPGPFASSDPSLSRLFGGRPSATGINVTEDIALNYSAWWSGVRTISGDVAQLPLFLYKRVGEDREKFSGHGLYRLLHDAPNPEMTSDVFRETVTAHALSWGNGYAEIERASDGRPAALHVLEPWRTQPFRDPLGALRYRVSNPSRPDSILTPDNILHIRGLGNDGVVGFSVVAKARESIGLGLGMERYGGSLYRNGASFGGVLTTKTRMTPPAKEALRAYLHEHYAGVDKVGKLLLLEEDMQFNPLTMPPHDAEFLASRKFQTEEVARWFNLPPHKIGDLSHSTNNNIENQSLDYLKSCLGYWLKRWEMELNTKLIAPLERTIQYFEFNVDGLLRPDSTARAALYKELFYVGAITPNGIARRENLPGLGPAGDHAFVPVNMTPIDHPYVADNPHLPPPPANAAPARQ